MNTPRLTHPQRPPHLRQASDPARTCHTCAYINRTTGICQRYHWQVTRTEVCDTWTPRPN